MSQDEKAMQRTVKANVRAIMRYLDTLRPSERREVIEHAATVYQTRRVARTGRGDVTCRATNRPSR